MTMHALVLGNTMSRIKSIFSALGLATLLCSNAFAQIAEPTPPAGMPDAHKTVVQEIAKALAYQQACPISKMDDSRYGALNSYMSRNKDDFDPDFMKTNGKYNNYFHAYSKYETQRIKDFINKKFDGHVSDASFHQKMMSCYHAVADFGEEGSLWANLLDISCTSFRVPYCSDENKFGEWIKMQSYVCDEKSKFSDLFAKDRKKFSCQKLQENICTLQKLRGGGGIASLGSGC